MAQLVQYCYGSYVHEPGEVVDMQYRETTNTTKRWYRDVSQTDVELHVELQACDWPTLKGKIDQLYDAYSTNEKKFVVLDENGADTRHVIDPANPKIMAGTIVAIIECPRNEMEEMVVKRTFKISLKGLFDASESELIYYEDSITHIGNCGPIWRIQPVVSGALGPLQYEVWPQSTQTIIQEGESMGFSGYYSPNAGRIGGTIPVCGIGIEHLEHRVDRPKKAQRYRNNGFWYYPWEWRYVFESTVDLSFQLPP